MHGMSGHSKWSKVKHQKATTDVVKGMAFTKAARAITIAVREGGGIGNPAHNFHLRLAMEKAHDVNMPKENIDRAIEKGLGAGSEHIEQIMYEGFGPHGVAIMVEAATDNRQRTVAAVKNVLDRAGGSLGSPGSIDYLFKQCGIVTVPKSVSFDALFEAAVSGGADDVVETDDLFEVYTSIASLPAVKQKLTEEGIAIDNTEIIMKPTSTVPIGDDKITQLDNLVEQLESLDDVQHVFTNATT